MIKAGIIGATGYAGAELVRILMNHKEVEIAWYGSRSLSLIHISCVLSGMSVHQQEDKPELRPDETTMPKVAIA